MTSTGAAPVLGNPDRDNLLTPIRLALAVAVLVPHAFIAVPTPVIPTETEVAIVKIGDYAVNGFFILSGFLIAKSLIDRRDLIGFAVSRILRLMPALLLLAFAMAFVFGPILTRLPLAAYFGDPQTWAFPWKLSFFVDATASLPGVFENSRRPAVSAPTWTLRHEALAYLGGAIAWAIGIWRGRLGALAILAGATALYLVARVPAVQALLPDTLFEASRFGVCFALGGVAYFFRDRIPLKLWPIAIGAVVLAVSVWLWPQNALIGNVVGGYALLVLAYRFEALAGRLREMPDLSYGVYIWHIPVFHSLLSFAPSLHPIALIAIGAPISLVIGWVSWRWIEKPALAAKPTVSAWVKSLFTSRRVRAA